MLGMHTPDSSSVGQETDPQASNPHGDEPFLQWHEEESTTRSSKQTHEPHPNQRGGETTSETSCNTVSERQPGSSFTKENKSSAFHLLPHTFPTPRTRHATDETRHHADPHSRTKKNNPPASCWVSFPPSRACFLQSGAGRPRVPPSTTPGPLTPPAWPTGA